MRKPREREAHHGGSNETAKQPQRHRHLRLRIKPTPGGNGGGAPTGRPKFCGILCVVWCAFN